MMSDELRAELDEFCQSFDGKAITDALESEVTLAIEAWIRQRLCLELGLPRHTIRFVAWVNRSLGSLDVFMDVDSLRPYGRKPHERAFHD